MKRGILAALARDARFEVRRELGRSWAAVVYEVWDHVDGATRALKVLDGPARERTAMLRRLARDLRVLDRVEHAALLGVHRRGLLDGRPYLVMDLAEGGSIAGWVGRFGPLPVEPALALVARAARAVDAVHRAGLLHRHLKPQNLLMCGRGVAVGDFASASSFSRPYAAPEQLRGGQAGPASDIYGLGATLYALTTACAPLDLHRAGRQGLTELHPLVEALVLRACHSQPERRHASAAALAVELEEVGRELVCPWVEEEEPGQMDVLRRLWEEWRAR